MVEGEHQTKGDGGSEGKPPGCRFGEGRPCHQEISDQLDRETHPDRADIW